jgi:hypothetical protein
MWMGLGTNPSPVPLRLVKARERDTLCRRGDRGRTFSSTPSPKGPCDKSAARMKGSAGALECGSLLPLSLSELARA